jgi:hypothetical protein
VCQLVTRRIKKGDIVEGIVENTKVLFTFNVRESILCVCGRVCSGWPTGVLYGVCGWV